MKAVIGTAIRTVIRTVMKSETGEKKADIVIRADGNAHIGAGHLMRCLTIAEEVGDRERVVFWCADETGAAQVRTRGYQVQTLETDYRDMESELALLEKMAGKGKKIFLVDSYYVSSEYLRALRTFGAVYLLEDVPGHVWPVDGVINYNAFAVEEDYRKLYEQSMRPRLYIGAAYVPLRRQFTGRRYQVRDQVRELLLTTGGGDRENIAGQILETISDIIKDICIVHVVSGPYNPHGEWLDSYAKAHPQVRVHRQVEDMARLMQQCDLAVTAGGTTVYELCALGVPFVCFSYAGNQEALTAYAGQQEIGLDAGQFHRDPEGTLERIKGLTRQAAVDMKLRQRMSRRAREMVDGAGAKRLAAALEAAGDLGREEQR